MILMLSQNLFFLIFGVVRIGLRVLGIGRNEYLALISEIKTNSTKLFRKPNPMNFLPKFPVRINIEPWWKVEIGYVLESDVKVLKIIPFFFFVCLLFICLLKHLPF